MQGEPFTMDDAQEFIARAAWRSATTVEDYAPHQYLVTPRSNPRANVSEDEFWQFASLIKSQGRAEVWTPPPEWVGGKPMRGRYLYIGEYAYWFTWPRKSVPMLNREHVSVQERDRTRTVLSE